MLRLFLLKSLGIWALFVLSGVMLAHAQSRGSLAGIDVQIMTDDGRAMQQYPVRGSRDTYRAYLEADKGMGYGIKLHNRSRHRVGVVIAVDGRNIISGQRSELQPNERMYILNPGQEAVYRGWRTGQNRINRFYFSDAADSYAAAWDDKSALGVIAVAAFREQTLQTYQQEKSSSAAPKSGKRSEPGTGFGNEEYSPTTSVVFYPEQQASARYFIKYEWRESLCDRQVLECAPPVQLTLGDVSVDIVDERGRVFQQIPVRGKKDTYRAYLEAVQNVNYGIRIRNGSEHRIALVIAVDGRNIISGQRSELQPNERMYIVGPRQEQVFQGWRTGQNRINRFYFTDTGDSYAAAWQDHSAMGVIAVAAFQEKVSVRPQSQISRSEQRARPSAKSKQAGTGFGDEAYSPSRKVEFEPLKEPFGRYFVKYEWRDTLCRENIIKCQTEQPNKPENRFWDDKDDGFAPPPPGRQSAAWAESYATTAVEQQQRNLALQCGYRGARWHEDYNSHLNWATEVSRQQAASETQLRNTRLQECEERRAQTATGEQWAEFYARTAVAQQEDNLFHRCGFRGGRWHVNYRRHYRYALEVAQQESRAEISFRRRALEQCRK